LADRPVISVTESDLDVAAIVVCPDCGGALECLQVEVGRGGMICHDCLLVHPVDDGILILLPKDARSLDIEGPLIDRFAGDLENGDRERLASHLERTRSCLKDSVGTVSWEWEDEAFWTEEYSRMLKSDEVKNWNDRLWERQPLIDSLRADVGTLQGRVILDVGSGEGDTFLKLLAPMCDSASLYIAVDISLAALRLNRRRNSHLRSLYILSSASQLPVRVGTVDLLCYWGILHHTEQKEGSVAQHSNLLKHGGYLALYEALERPTLASIIGRTPVDQSAHEETLDRERLFASIQAVPDYEPLLVRHSHTAFYGAAIRGPFGAMVTTRPGLFKVVAAIDQALLRIGRFVPLFLPGAVLMLIKRR
jgi:ubiquinone/menaquinone biosynthesis C-methylase UbiE/uncharacterized protein YbaR (Trm112 family)